MGIVYKITSDISKKSYIGVTTRTMEIRWNAHKERSRNNSMLHFHNAIRKYGSDTFKIEIIESDIDVSDIYEREMYWIEYYDTYNNGYNMNFGGKGGMSGTVFVKDKNGHVVCLTSNEYQLHKEKYIHHNTGKLVCKNHNGEFFSVDKNDDSIKNKILYPLRTGVPCSDDTKEKIRTSNKKIMESGLTKAQEGYIKRNNTLTKKDPEFLKNIGMKSSKTQKENELNKGKNNPNFNINLIVLFNNDGDIIDKFNNIDLSTKKEYPIRMIQWCLRNHKPMYTYNKPKREELFKFIGWYACYENEMYCYIDVNRRIKCN